MDNLRVPLLGEQDEDSEWIPSARKKWIPSVKKPRQWGTNLPKPRKQWQRQNFKQKTKFYGGK